MTTFVVLLSLIFLNSLKIFRVHDIILLYIMEFVSEWRNGRRARLRGVWATVRVRVPPRT